MLMTPEEAVALAEREGRREAISRCIAATASSVSQGDITFTTGVMLLVNGVGLTEDEATTLINQHLQTMESSQCSE